jgi:CRISPR-associated protein Cas5d
VIPYCLDVSGDFACFTRPEMKVERVSYDVMTPSAARAVFEAILWKPAIRWHIRRIEVLKPIRWMSLRRNEVAGVISHANVKSAMKAGSGSSLGARRTEPGRFGIRPAARTGLHAVRSGFHRSG